MRVHARALPCRYQHNAPVIMTFVKFNEKRKELAEAAEAEKAAALALQESGAEGEGPTDEEKAIALLIKRGR